MCTSLESLRRVPKLCFSLQDYCSFRTAKTAQTPSSVELLASTENFHVHFLKTICNLKIVHNN